MSMHHDEMIECPACHKKSSFRVWQSINTTINPEMRKKVLDGSAFIFTCKHCGEHTLVDYGCIYHLMKDSIMIAYMVSDSMSTMASDLFEGQGSDSPFEKDFKKHNYLLRTVRSQTELREKAHIFEDGLDDRIVEMCKLIMLAQLYEEHPELYNKVTAYYTGEKEPHFELFSESDGLGTCNFSKEIYDALQEQLAGQLPDIRKDVPVVDAEYAEKMLEKLMDKK